MMCEVRNVLHDTVRLCAFFVFPLYIMAEVLMLGVLTRQTSCQTLAWHQT